MKAIFSYMFFSFSANWNGRE